MPQCKAKARSGQRCRKSAAPGKTVCRNHGGRSTGPKEGKSISSQNALKHGIYSDVLSEEERAVWDIVKIGDVDDELRLCRVKLRRALQAQTKAEASPQADALELQEIKAGGEMVMTTCRRPDYAAAIDRLLGRIGQLEKTRVELMAATAGEDAGQVARDVSQMLRTMMAVELEQPDEPEQDAGGADGADGTDSAEDGER